MATPPNPLKGDPLLAAVTDAMVALHERYYHRPPGSAKTGVMATTCWRACSAASTPTSRKR